MDDLSEAELGYAAGFFDGDGTLALGGSPNAIRIHCCVTQKELPPLTWFQERFGGSIVRERDRYWRWTPVRKETFIRAIAPYLVLKRERAARLISDYYDIAGLRMGSQGLTSRQIEVRTELLSWFRLQTLATIGKPSTLGGDANAISAL